MGSWNATCGVTQLSICRNDPIMLFFLVARQTRKTNHDGFFAPHSMWTPRYLPISGVYDDYGGVEDVVENISHSYLLSHIKDELVQARLGGWSQATNGDEDAHPTDQLELDHITVEDLIKEIGHSRLWLPGFSSSVPVGMMMVHTWAWDHLTLSVERDWTGDLSLQQVKQQGLVYYRSLRELTAMYDSTELMWRRQEIVPFTSMWSVFNGDSVHSDSLGSTIYGLGDLRFEFESLSRNNRPESDPQVLELIEATSRMLMFDSNLDHLRKMWMPQNGLGSQRCNQQAHLELNQLMQSKIKEKLQQLDHWHSDHD
jgi:hypothetical protein